jgi:hypothetical protein
MQSTKDMQSTESRDPDTGNASGQAAAGGEGGEGSFGKGLSLVEAFRNLSQEASDYRAALEAETKYHRDAARALIAALAREKATEATIRVLVEKWEKEAARPGGWCCVTAARLAKGDCANELEAALAAQGEHDPRLVAACEASGPLLRSGDAGQ